ncbi:MAG: molybdenum cofactor guanylyltransferase [Bradymonadaceae bacterium]
MTDITIAILAGGESRRMGRDKASLELGGRTLLARTVSVAQSVADRILVVGRTDAELPDDVEAPALPDRTSGRGPMGGIRTALGADERPVLAVACDMPRLGPEAIAWAVDPPVLAGAEAVATARGDSLEPLFSLYMPSLMPELDARLEANDLAMHALLEDVETIVRPIPDALADQLDDADSPADWREIRASLHLDE